MHPKRLVQSLKGSQAQVLWAFLFAWSALDVFEVMSWTALKRDTCYQALKNLEVDFLGTQTLAHGRKVWLLKSEMLPVLRDIAIRAGTMQVIDANSEKSIELLDVSVKRTPGKSTNLVDVSVKRTPADGAPIQNSADSFKLKDSSSSSKLSIGQEEEEELSVQESEKRTPGNPDFEAVHAACMKKGIRDPKASVLAALPRTTPEKVIKHVDTALAEGNSIGTAIYRIQHDWTIPEMTQTKDSKREDYFSEYLAEQREWEQSEHEDDCTCINCHRSFPERFCQHQDEGNFIRGGTGLVFRQLPPCGNLLKPGQKFCDRHQHLHQEEGDDD